MFYQCCRSDTQVLSALHELLKVAELEANNVIFSFVCSISEASIKWDIWMHAFTLERESAVDLHIKE